MLRTYWDADGLSYKTAITAVFILNGAMAVEDDIDCITSERNIKSNHNKTWVSHPLSAIVIGLTPCSAE